MKKRQEVYDLYWYFACERQNIFWKKINGESAPWTEDKILQEYKFCNSYRVNDRVSQYLLRNVIYNDKKYSDEDMLFRILLFKLFNKESTWELLLNNFEDITLKTFNVKDYSKVLENAISSGIKIYNDAYISCANKAFGYDRKHDNHLALLNKMFNEDRIQNKIIKCKTMEEAFNIIKSYPLIGNFMAYQLVTDINYSEVVNWQEDEFTVVGPGSLRGIKKCFIDKGKMSNEDIIKYTIDPPKPQVIVKKYVVEDLTGRIEEEKEKNKERIRKAYGESASGIGSKNIRKRRHIYIFNPEDLDNADIISMVESSPTYLRDKSTLSTIKTKAATEGQLATEEAQGGEDMGGVITF